MTELNPNTPATIPEQPDAKPPLKKSMPVVIALVAILAILGIANVTTLGRILVAITVLQSAHSPNESAKDLREAAEFYKVDVAAITVKVKEEFAAKEKAQATRKATDKAKPTQQRTAAKKAKAA